jgi:hypothetical protein
MPVGAPPVFARSAAASGTNRTGRAWTKDGSYKPRRPCPMNPNVFNKDERVLILRDELEVLWGAKDVFHEVQSLQGEIAREAPGRQTLRFELAGNFYYRKLHSGVGWVEILKNIFQFRLPVIGAANEWQALNRLAEIGIRSFIPVAYGEKYTNPARRLSFIVTRELTGTQQLDHYLREHKQAGALGFDEKRALLGEMARIAFTVHRHGINHRDLYLCHFLVDLASMEQWKKTGAKPDLYLADLHRAQIRCAVPRRWLVKDIASICFSILETGLSVKDVMRAMVYYFNRPLINVERENPGLLQQIKKRTLKLYRREQRLRLRNASDVDAGRGAT